MGGAGIAGRRYNLPKTDDCGDGTGCHRRFEGREMPLLELFSGMPSHLGLVNLTLRLTGERPEER